MTFLRKLRIYISIQYDIWKQMNIRPAKATTAYYINGEFKVKELGYNGVLMTCRKGRANHDPHH